MKQTKALGRCYFGQDVKKLDYVIMRHAKDSVTSIYYGYDVLNVPRNVIEKDGIGLVVDILRNTMVRDMSKDRDREDKPTLKRLLKYKKDCLFVVISLLGDVTNETLEIHPMHAGHGWRFEWRLEEKKELRLPLTNEDFLKCLAEALEIAS